MTIPRLELSAAVMLTKLTVHCMTILNLQTTPCYLWTDLSIVQTWLNNHPSRWKDFVRNRACVIQETLPDAQWRHTSGQSNPADCGTRGLSASELNSHRLWWSGLPWLSGDPSQFPNIVPPVSNPSNEMEERVTGSKQVTICTPTLANVWKLLNRYSTLNKLIRVTATIIRAILKFRKKPNAYFLYLLPEEFTKAVMFWIHEVSKQHFKQEFEIIQDCKELPKSHPMTPLVPFIDGDGLLRVGSRLSHSKLQ